MKRVTNKKTETKAEEIILEITQQDYESGLKAWLD